MKKGKIIHSPLFSLYRLQGVPNALAVVASKKVSKKAVARNRNRRRVREAIRKQYPTILSGACIIFVKKDLSALSHPDLIEGLTVLLNKAI